MKEVTIIGVDLSKNVFQLHRAAADGAVVFRKKLSRLQFHRFMSEHPRCVVAIEACGGAHRWAREVERLGHQVRLIAPRYVKPFIKRQKNDDADAEAIVEAGLRPTMRYVEPKTQEQQARAIVFRIEKIQAMSGGRLTIQHFAAGELIPAFEGFDAVVSGTVESNAANSYFWSGKTFAAQYFTAVPFYNLPPPTQGVSSLAILAILDRLGRPAGEDFAFVHATVEATKQAFLVRDAEVRDLATMAVDPASLVSDAAIARMAAAIDAERALPWRRAASPGDTIWMGAIDADGRAVSFIQSLYWEFGSGLVSSRTGVLWQNRGISFSLAEAHPNRLVPGRLPFHTLNPPLARFEDGRTLVYGTMGGEGQPQTQAAVFARYAWGGMALQQAITAPRWLLGRTWGSQSTTLKLEQRWDADVVAGLRRAGHDTELVEGFSDLMGHAGAVVRHVNGLLEGAADPRSDGAVAAARPVQG